MLLKDTIRIYFGDTLSDYVKMKDFLKNDIQSDKELYTSLLDQLQKLLLEDETFLNNYIKQSSSMGISVPSFVRSGSQRSRVFLEKLYFDLFHEDSNFKPNLLNYVDPKTGELKPDA